MSLRSVGLVLLLVGSLALGVGFGELSFRLFVSAIPPVALSTFNQSSAHVTYWSYGVGGGLAIFLWALLAVGLAPLFKKRRAPGSAAAAPPEA